MKYSIVIATHKRPTHLADTLASLAGLRPDGPWEVIVVDNHSSGATRAVVDLAAATFPVRLQYASEAQRGGTAAVNCGIQLTGGDIVITTGDDVRVAPEWVNRLGAGLDAHRCDFVGGSVMPIWETKPPSWLSTRPGLLWRAIALLDYGPAAIKFGRRIPLGLNMAIRRETIVKVGEFNAQTGPEGGTLPGHDMRDWCVRARAIGSEGYYLPDAPIEHLIASDRLTKHYFRQWFYRRGVTRAMLYRQAGLKPELPGRNPAKFAPQWFGVPRYLYRSAALAVRDGVAAAWRRDRVATFERELWLCMFAGMFKQRWRDRGMPSGAPTRQRAASPRRRSHDTPI